MFNQRKTITTVPSEFKDMPNLNKTNTVRWLLGKGLTRSGVVAYFKAYFPEEPCRYQFVRNVELSTPKKK
jgi:hypothetical protein